MLHNIIHGGKLLNNSFQNIRDGVFDVIPASSVDSLTAEDLRLLLNGVGDINVSTLISYTSFNDESAESTEKLHRFVRDCFITNREDLINLL